MAWAYRLLETRGISAHVDSRAAAQMRDDGVTDDTIAEIGAVLDAMRQNKLVSNRPDRLQALVEKAGGEPTPMNLALTQETIHRALAEANFQTSRRYDGFRIENKDCMETILRERTCQVSGRSGLEKDGALLPSQSQGDVGHRDLPWPVVSNKELSSLQAHQAAGAPNSNNIADVEALYAAHNETAPRQPARAPSPSRTSVVPPSAHPVTILGAQLIKKNAAVWDIKTQRQAAQIYGLLAKLLCEKAVYEFGDLRQSHFADLDDLLASVAKSYGKSSKDESRSTAELRLIGGSKPPAERGLAPETLNRHFTFLGQLLTFVRGRGHKLNREIDLTLLRARTKGRARDKRATFRPSELDAVFRLPCFSGCAGWKRDEAFFSRPTHLSSGALFCNHHSILYWRTPRGNLRFDD